MGRSGLVWGIDVGQCALKALRCRAGDEPDKIVVEAFDFIEYPKLLSQPDAVPGELISEALAQFLSRNSVRNDRVAISVSGQSGLARFIKLPPVEAKKIPDIVRYEARQQIPFDLNDVIWDYQRMGGGSEEEGFALETEIGLFAMKRDAVFRALEPFEAAGIELDFVQLTPLALYNFVLFDQLGDLPSLEEYDPENPPESVVVVSLGTDSTDLVVTNGFRVWQRSIPLGGNHFTKALTKELKLTFAKAEHLKRNATTAQDPKAIFQAMRPVFNDLLTELQRSLSFFSNMDRHAKIGRVVALGNAFKLPGLRRYLSQSLGFEIQRVDSFRGLEGSEVTAAPSFKENILSFGVCYGLALQGLGKGGLKTNLLPKEILRDRLIREKKPWAVAAAATLLLACSLSFAAYSASLGSVSSRLWGDAEIKAKAVTKKAADFKHDCDVAVGDYLAVKQIGDHLVGNIEGRVSWLELLKAINESLPQNDPKKKIPDNIWERNELHVTNLECQRVDDLAQWFNAMKAKGLYTPPGGAGGGGPAASGPAALPAAHGPAALPAAHGPPGGAPGMPAPASVLTTDSGPKGPGWVIQIKGHHYHNKPNPHAVPHEVPAQGFLEAADFVRSTLMHNLVTGKIVVPSAEGKGVRTVSMKDLGISYPVLVSRGKVYRVYVDNPKPIVEGGSKRGEGALPVVEGEHPPVDQDKIALDEYDMVIHFCWQPTLASQRDAEKADKAEKAEHQTP
ncbi:MAG: type IV pilus assembly protein PilM [Thermoguttaceae bacterium]